MQRVDLFVALAQVRQFLQRAVDDRQNERVGHLAHPKQKQRQGAGCRGIVHRSTLPNAPTGEQVDIGPSHKAYWRSEPQRRQECAAARPQHSPYLIKKRIPVSDKS
jgi:hypothetical protein